MLTFVSIGNYGRFGNQLFQYCSVYGIAKKRGFEFWVPNNQSLALGEVFDELKITKDLEKFRSIDKIFQEPVPGSTIFFSQAFDVPDNTNFIGYFQSPKYFSHCEKELKQHLKIKSIFSDVVDKFIDKNAIDGFIHVRRSDYVTSCGGNCHPPVTVDYLKQAMEASMCQKFVVISDDIEWCRTNLNFADVVFSPFSERHFGYDFALMTRCNAAIISNSSFSWWGAWLGEKRIVVAPSVWFGPDPSVPKSWQDIYCEGWKVI